MTLVSKQLLELIIQLHQRQGSPCHIDAGHEITGQYVMHGYLSGIQFTDYRVVQQIQLLKRGAAESIDENGNLADLVSACI
ncbi:hypothetical protein D3C75_797550 [compost metagenome]